MHFKQNHVFAAARLVQSLKINQFVRITRKTLAPSPVSRRKQHHLFILDHRIFFIKFLCFFLTVILPQKFIHPGHPGRKNLLIVNPPYLREKRRNMLGTCNPEIILPVAGRRARAAHMPPTAVARRLKARTRMPKLD